MDEFDFIRSIQQKTYSQAGLMKGIGDDAAVFRSSYQDIVTSVDTFVENIHFSFDTMQPFHIGYRALAANISDMAAMGALPAYYLISIVIPKGFSDEKLKQIYQGMDKLASVYNMDLIGGDTVSGNELMISVTIIGFVEKGKARYRNQANPGDIVFVTGTLGDSAAGLHVLTNLQVESEYEYFVNRHRMPSPRVGIARKLSHVSRLALNDVSDGIANEAAEIAEASGVTIHINYNDIPYHSGLKAFSEQQQRDWKLSGGEDFELIGTVSSDDWKDVLKAAELVNTRVTNIGYVSDNGKTNGTVYLHDKNRASILTKSGYTHLK